MKKWSDYLTSRTYIAEAMWVSNRTVDYWAEYNKVPEWHFIKLESVLASIGHELTPKQMRDLNDTTKD